MHTDLDDVTYDDLVCAVVKAIGLVIVLIGAAAYWYGCILVLSITNRKSNIL